MNLTPTDNTGSPPLQGQWERGGSEYEKHKRDVLWAKTKAFRDEVNRTESAHRMAAIRWRSGRMAMIAAAVVLVFFGVPGLISALGLICAMMYLNPLVKAIRNEVAAELCVLLSCELSSLMALEENIQYMEGRLAGLMSLREQLIRMQKDVPYLAYHDVMTHPNPLDRQPD